MSALHLLPLLTFLQHSPASVRAPWLLLRVTTVLSSLISCNKSWVSPSLHPKPQCQDVFLSIAIICLFVFMDLKTMS